MPQSRMAIITFMEGGEPVDPGFGIPGGGGYPSNGLPGFPGRPDNSLPGGGHIVTLPVFPFDPTKPDNELPAPPVIWPPRPGSRFVVKFLACHGLILVPDNDLPDEAQPRS